MKPILWGFHETNPANNVYSKIPNDQISQAAS